MKTPIIFIIFNRSDKTKKVFEMIKKAQPEKLIVIADGPRSHMEREMEICEETRKIIKSVDWNCEVIKDYSDINLGCKRRVSSGITNAFKLVDRAIILEDDCLPNQSFFYFCEELLEKYSNNQKIMSITGDNFLFDKSSIIKESYYFSKFPYIWGWATWKRAWDKYDVTMRAWPEIKNKKIIPRNWKKRFEDVYLGKIDTWDIQWTFCCLVNNGLSIVPHKNLISNIGFSSDSTHTKIKTTASKMKIEEINFSLIHPDKIIANEKADKISQFHFTKTGIIIDYIKSFIKL